MNQILQSLTNLLGCGRRNQSCSKVGGSKENKVETTSGATYCRATLLMRRVAEPPTFPATVHVKTQSLKEALSKRDNANDSTTDGSDSDTLDTNMLSRHTTPEHLPAEPPPGLANLSAMKAPFEEAHVPTSTPSELDEVLKKLSPEDVATLQRIFEAKQDPSQKVTKTRDFPSEVPKAQNLISLLSQSRQTKGVASKTHKTPCQSQKDAMSLRSNLQKLEQTDSSRIFMARKINKLGLNSPTILKAYFQRFGPIEDVFVTHAVDKANPSRLRAAGVGFIVMKKAEDVLKILQHEHVIQGLSIVVGNYEHRPSKEAERS
jgi:hypothetical protein